MNSSAWNIVRKDFRLTQNFLVAWWVILTTGAIITAWNLNQILLDPGDFYQAAHQDVFIFTGGFFQDAWPYLSNWVVLGLDAVLLAVLVDLIIKADSPIDERAPWHTRPVSGPGVWRAKLLYLGLFCYGVPGIIQTLERLYLGSDWANCLHGLVHFAIIQSVLVAYVASAAVLFHRTFTGLLVFCGVVFVILLLDQTEYFTEITLDNPSSPFREGLPIAWIVLGLFCFTGLVVTTLMYAGHQRKTGLLTLGGGMLAAIVAYLFWMKHPSVQPEIAPQRDDRVQISLSSLISNVNRIPDNFNAAQLFLSSQITLRGTTDSVLHVNEVHARLSWPSQKLRPISTTQPWHGLFNLTGAVAAAGYGHLLMENPPYYPDTPLSWPKEWLTQAAALSAHWEGTVTGEMGRLVVDWDIPYAEHAHWTHNESLFKLEARNAPATYLDFMLWEISPTYSPWLSVSPMEDDLRVILLYNPVKHEAIPGSMGTWNGGRENLSVYSITASGAYFDLTEIFGTKYPIFPDRGVMHGFYRNQLTDETKLYVETWQHDKAAFAQQHKQEMDNWLAGAHLVELHFVPDHSVYNTATSDSVQIITSQAAKAAGLSTP